jgi:hypothetical protein
MRQVRVYYFVLAWGRVSAAETELAGAELPAINRSGSAGEEGIIAASQAFTSLIDRERRRRR